MCGNKLRSVNVFYKIIKKKTVTSRAEPECAYDPSCVIPIRIVWSTAKENLDAGPV